jgi:YHS domain-containing protein
LSYPCKAAKTAGCAATGQPKPDGKPHAECLVCKYNADLACVDVAVENDTPSCQCNGQTYYFCSDVCRAAFMKNPALYLSQK